MHTDLEPIGTRERLSQTMDSFRLDEALRVPCVVCYAASGEPCDISAGDDVVTFYTVNGPQYVHKQRVEIGRYVRVRFDAAWLRHHPGEPFAPLPRRYKRTRNP